MFIKNLKLKNYGAIKNGELEFQKGFNILGGANGRGKSHIIRALAYLLLNHNEGKIEDDCNWDSDTFNIKTELEYNNKNFVIENSFNRKNGVNKKLSIDNDSIDTNKDVVEKLSEYFNPSYCKPALIAFQGDMDVVNATPSSRRENLKKIYDLNFQKEIKLFEDELTYIQKEIEKVNTQISILDNKSYDLHKKEELPFSEDDIREKKNQLEKLRKEKSDIDNKLENHKLKVQKVENLRKYVEDKNNQIIKLRDNITSLEKKIKEYKNTLKNPDYSKINKLKKQISNIVLERIPSNFDTQEIDNKKEKLRKEKNSLDNIQKDIKLIKKGKCPTCGRDFHDVDLKSYEDRYSSKENIVGNLNEEINQLQDKYDNWKKKKDENNRKKNQKEQIKQQLNFEEEKLNDITENSKNSIKEKLTEIEEIKNSVIHLQNEKQELEEELKQAEIEQPEEPDKLYDSINIIKIKIESIEKDIENYNIIINKNKWIEKENEKILLQKDNDLKEKKELDKKYNKFNKEIKEYESSINILKKDFPNYIINSLKQEIENGMNDILNEAYNGRYHVQIKEKGSGLSIYYGNDKEIKLASGAEKNLFTIGFKNAFTKIAGLKVLILDESDNYMDEDIAKNTFKVLNSLIEQDELQQVILISHKQSVKEMLEADYNAKIFEVKDGNVVCDNS